MRSSTPNSLASVSGAALELRGLVKRYPDSVALAGIDLSIVAGEFLTLLGPSGSGKTTTLNLIAGFAEPTEGEIEVDGKPIAKVPPHKRNIGVVFQHYALFPHMTVGENVAYPLKRRKLGKPEIAERVKTALELVEMTQLQHRRPKELSGGQQQRVALARAIVFNPPVLLMDEPLGALDRRLRDSLQRQIRRLHRELGITFVYVTHDQDEAMVLSDRIAIFNAGQIEQIGAPRELYEHPRTGFVAQFLGESNFFEGTVDGHVLECADGVTVNLPPTVSLNGASSHAVGIRPEHITLGPPGAAGACAQGVVRDIYYLGSDVRCEVAVGADRMIVVARAADAKPAIAEGDRVSIAWDPAAVVPLSAAG